eukprot:TRINITY_DN12158_c0_g2_i3.p1 TRINITY_DN12158_c0_g2~~TRINITY_DN12158_c0_g2_i3.p1  ORF type:complete len:411 (-),score=166.25 TRINITY_DN12158_c0_g2_i3:227-1459(-)
MEEKANSLSQVLAYYRKRIDDLQEERLSWLEQLELAKLSQEDFQKNELELERRVQEIAELQKAISDSHIALFEEKELVLRLRREGEELRAKAADDKRKMKELLALTDAGEKGITYYKDCRPGLFSSEVVGKMESLNSGKENPKGKKVVGKVQLQAQRQPRQVLRTVVLPNEQITSLQLEVENLRQINNEHKWLYEQQLASLKEDQMVREEEMKLKYEDLKEKIQVMDRRLQKDEEMNYAITKGLPFVHAVDYLNDKHECQARETQAQKENKALRRANEQLQVKLKDTKSRTQQQLQRAESEKDQSSSEVMGRFRDRVQGNEESLQIIKEQYLKLQQVYMEKIRALEESLETARKSYRSLMRRRRQEVESFYRDIEGVKRKTRIYDSYLHRVKKLIDQNPKEIIGTANWLY